MSKQRQSNQPRVSEYWHPERSLIEIHRNRDKRLAATALVGAPAHMRDETHDLVYRRFPDMLADQENLYYGDLIFDRSETPLVVNSLVSMARIPDFLGPLEQRRASSLVGDLVVVAGIQVVDARSMPTVPTQ